MSCIDRKNGLCTLPSEDACPVHHDMRCCEICEERPDCEAQKDLGDCWDMVYKEVADNAN